jgi:hypothetical protein
MPIFMSPGTPRPEVDLAAREPARSISAFTLQYQPPPPGPRYLEIAYFLVGCRSCGHDEFHLGAYPTSPPTSWAAPDKPILLPPHRLRCARCGSTNMLFDPKTDGYNGVICNLSAVAPGGPEEMFSPTPLKTHVTSSYNIDLPELQQLAAEAGNGVKATDLFDWINIIQSAPEQDYYLELDYECA